MNVQGGSAVQAVRVDTYLASLPRGVDSYPECMHRAEPLAVWLQRTPTAGVARLLPPQAAAWLDRDRPTPSWLSEVHACAIYLAIRQMHFADDAAFVAHARECNRAVLRTLTARLVFLAATPRAVLRVARLLWANLHRGSTMEVRFARDTSAEGLLSFPRGLFPEVILRGNATGFAAAIEHAGGRDVEVQLRRTEPSPAIFAARWR
jgi:hypothetical protein